MVNKDAVGLDINGKRLTFDTEFWWVLALDRDLIFLEIPAGVVEVNCQRNRLKELHLPPSVMILTCDKELFDYDTCNLDDVTIYYGPEED